MATTTEELASSPTLAFILFLASLLIILVIRTLFNSSSTSKLPPSPPSLPILGHLHLLSGDLPHRSLQKLASCYGPLMYLRLGSVPTIIVSSPSLARDFLKTHDYAVSTRPSFTASDILGSAGFALAPMGSFWRSIKRFCVTELFCARSLERFRPIREQEVRSFLLSIMESAGEPLDMGKRLSLMSGNVVSRMTINKRLDEAMEWWSVVKESLEITGEFYIGDFLGFLKKLDPWGYQKRCRALYRRFDALTEGILAEHEERRGRMKTEDDKESERVDVHGLLQGRFLSRIILQCRD